MSFSFEDFSIAFWPYDHPGVELREGGYYLELLVLVLENCQICMRALFSVITSATSPPSS